jgi:copper chaperone CopZ
MEAAHFVCVTGAAVCAARLETAVRKMQGVIAVRTDPALGVATVLFDPRRIHPLDIGDRVARTGLRARMVARES